MALFELHAPAIGVEMTPIPKLDSGLLMSSFNKHLLTHYINTHSTHYVTQR